MRLITSIYDDVKYHRADAIRPYGVLNALVELDIVEESRASDDFQNLHPLNIMRGSEHYLSVAYKNIFPNVKKVKRDHIIDYIAQDAGERVPLLEQLKSEAPGKSRSKKVASFLILERQAKVILQRMSVREVMKGMMGLLEDGKTPLDKINELQETYLEDIPITGYGVPQGKEWEILEEDIHRRQNIDLSEVFDTYSELFKVDIEKYSRKMQEIERNIQKANDLLRQ